MFTYILSWLFEISEKNLIAEREYTCVFFNQPLVISPA